MEPKVSVMIILAVGISLTAYVILIFLSSSAIWPVDFSPGTRLSQTFDILCQNAGGKSEALRCSADLLLFAA